MGPPAGVTEAALGVESGVGGEDMIVQSSKPLIKATKDVNRHADKEVT
jgi:hypothetical protein